MIKVQDAFIVLVMTALILLSGCQEETAVPQSEQIEQTPQVQEAATKQASEPDTPSQKNNEAEQKLLFAENNLKMAQKGILSYSQFIVVCRGVIKDYPGTPYEQQARLFLQQVPEDQRSRFNITNEELGL